MTFNFPDGIYICACGHEQKIHRDHVGICWGDPRDMELTLCPCNKFTAHIKIFRIVSTGNSPSDTEHKKTKTGEKTNA